MCRYETVPAIRASNPTHPGPRPPDLPLQQPPSRASHESELTTQHALAYGCAPSSGNTPVVRPEMLPDQIGTSPLAMTLTAAINIIAGQSGTYRHLQNRVTDLLADSGQTAH